MHVGGGGFICGNQLCFAVGLDMVLVTKVTFAIVGDPRCIGVLLPLLILAPLCGQFAFFDLLVLLPVIALNGCFHNRAIYQFAVVHDDALLVQERI